MKGEMFLGTEKQAQKYWVGSVLAISDTEHHSNDKEIGYMKRKGL